MLLSTNSDKSSIPKFNIIKFLLYGRWLLIGLAFIAGWHLLTYFRTMHYGETTSSFAFYFVGGGMVFIASLP
ncbi:MAG: hypothetical protein ACPG7F_21295, partial [Aggregatilineales bacterium]